MTKLWILDTERDFFLVCWKRGVSLDTLFYFTEEGRRYAFKPKGYKGKVKNSEKVQGRNNLIGTYSEEWVVALLEEIAEAADGYPVRGVICEELGLTAQSPADVAICKTPYVSQSPQNILMIIEVKMSLVWNWELIITESGDIDLVCIGDYKTHTGNPSLLRTDNVKKAITNCVDIRLSGVSTSHIPIVIIGNTPIAQSYYTKVDNYKSALFIQGVWSVNPNPLNYESADNIKATPGKGFYKFDNHDELKKAVLKLLTEEREYISIATERQSDQLPLRLHF